MLTPKGWFESRRLPGSGAGPSPDRLVLGSEGTLGIITECWLRLQKRPVFRATAGVSFPTWKSGYEAVREIAQAKLWPANLRILDPAEAEFSAGMSGGHALGSTMKSRRTQPSWFLFSAVRGYVGLARETLRGRE